MCVTVYAGSSGVNGSWWSGPRSASATSIGMATLP